MSKRTGRRTTRPQHILTVITCLVAGLVYLVHTSFELLADQRRQDEAVQQADEDSI